MDADNVSTQPVLGGRYLQMLGRVLPVLSILVILVWGLGLGTNLGTLAAPRVTEAQTERQAQLDKRLVEAVKKVPGGNFDPQDLVDPERQKRGFHPLGWLFKPITDLQAQTIRLQQQIMRLEGPIATLQPTMLDLQQRMVKLESEMTSVQGQLNTMRGDIVGTRKEIVSLQEPVKRLHPPLQRLEKPLISLEKPVSGMQARLADLQADMQDLELMMNYILTAIFLSAAAIAIGTPIAAILIWANRKKIFRKTKDEDLLPDSLARGSNHEPAQLSSGRFSV